VTGWTVVVPIRSWVGGKSRMEVDAAARETLGRAMALDTLGAAAACDDVERIVVVTATDAVAREATQLGAEIVSDPEAPSADPLNTAIMWAVVASAPAGPVAVLLGDVPALTAEALAEALQAARAHPTAFVPDADGTGTVLLAVASADLLAPAFGIDSAEAHRAGGAVRLDDMPARLRRDVDTLRNLDEARRLGVGPRTAAVS
jgi:2-phospho-L-lactate guanylyltransferase